MEYICVRTYGNGKYINKVFNVYFEYLSQAERVCKKLNEIDYEIEGSDKWIVVPVYKYIGKTW